MRRSLIAALSVLTLAAPTSLVGQDLTIDQVLEKHFEAIGGVEAWQDVQSVKMTGTMAMGPMTLPFTAMNRRPDHVRIEFTVQGMTGVQAYDGETAWMLMPFMGKTDPEEMPASDAKQLIEDADLDGPLIGMEEDGHSAELVGMEKVEGADAYHVKVTLKSGDVRDYYLDAEYFLPIKVSAKREIQGQEIEIVTSLSDYKEVDGLVMPHSISSQFVGAPAGANQSMTIEAVELNPTFEDSLFVMPKKGMQQ